MFVYCQAQVQHEQRQAITQGGGYPPVQAASIPPSGSAASMSSLYPALDSYMGLQLTPQFVQQNMPVVATHYPQVLHILFTSFYTSLVYGVWGSVFSFTTVESSLIVW